MLINSSNRHKRLEPDPTRQKLEIHIETVWLIAVQLPFVVRKAILSRECSRSPNEQMSKKAIAPTLGC